jgi:hypothetical protein
MTMTAKPLRKVLSYRDQSGQTLETHTEHWQGFTWEAGPIVVTHQGAAWGRVQVWAATAEEGKRVIRHAGEVAGVDPDAVGEWYIHSAVNSRYGKTGTMAPKPLGRGAIAVTMRAGPSGLPEVVVPSPGL